MNKLTPRQHQSTMPFSIRLFVLGVAWGVNHLWFYCATCVVIDPAITKEVRIGELKKKTRIKKIIYIN